MTIVPASFQPYVTEAATGTGIPASVVAAQANAESGFNANAVSNTGAEGWLQFEPGTYNDVAGAAGVPTGTEFSVPDETKAYITYMNQLLSEEGGSVFKALEAYNAGPGDLPAGEGYAAGILSAAGQPATLAASAPGTTSSASLTSFNPLNLLNPLSLIPGLSGSDFQGITDSIFGSIGSAFLKDLGVPSMKDLFQRLGLVLFGATLVIVGLSMLVKGPIITTAKTVEKDAPEAAAVA